MLSFGLIRNIDNKVNKTINGSFTINSKIDKKEWSNSCTSDDILATISPLFFSE